MTPRDLAGASRLGEAEPLVDKPARDARSGASTKSISLLPAARREEGEYSTYLTDEQHNRLSFDGPTLAAVLRLFMDTVARDYRRRVEATGVGGGLAGGITAIQRAQSDLRLNPLDSLLLDGVYAPVSAGNGKLAFYAAPTLRQEDVADVLSAARRRILRYLESRGILAPVAMPGGGEMGVAGEDALAEKIRCWRGYWQARWQGCPPRGRRGSLRRLCWSRAAPRGRPRGKPVA